MATSRIVVIGNGDIGREVANRAPAYKSQCIATVTRKGILRVGDSFLESFDPNIRPDDAAALVAAFCRRHGVQYVHLAIPSNLGLVEAAYIAALSHVGIKCITACKGALSDYDQLIHPYVSNLRYDAAVGGGTMILPFLALQSYIDDDLAFALQHPIAVMFVPNGTTNFVLSEIDNDRHISRVLKDAAVLKFAEPSANGKLSALDVLLAERKDSERKASIVCNRIMRTLTERAVTSGEFTPQVPLTPEDALRLTAGNRSYRFFACMCTNPEDLGFLAKPEMSGYSRVQIGHLHVAMGYVEVGGALAKWAPHHVDNVCRITQNLDTVTVTGHGAGPDSTVATMYANQRSFMRPLYA